MLPWACVCSGRFRVVISSHNFTILDPSVIVWRPMLVLRTVGTRCSGSPLVSVGCVFNVHFSSQLPSLWPRYVFSNSAAHEVDILTEH
jgi:hypothetical protein